eukprot:8737261-Ditylum_brightwellii.AAC.1
MGSNVIKNLFSGPKLFSLQNNIISDLLKADASSTPGTKAFIGMIEGLILGHSVEHDDDDSNLDNGSSMGC